MNVSEFKSFTKTYKGFSGGGSKTKTIPLFLDHIKTTRTLSNDPSKSMENTTLKRYLIFGTL